MEIEVVDHNEGKPYHQAKTKDTQQEKCGAGLESQHLGSKFQGSRIGWNNKQRFLFEMSVGYLDDGNKEEGNHTARSIAEFNEF